MTFDAVDKTACSLVMSRPATAHVKFTSLSIVLAISSTTNWPVKPDAPNTTMLNFRGSAGSMMAFAATEMIDWKTKQMVDEIHFKKFMKSCQHHATDTK